MYEETDADGKRRYTVNQIAAEFGVPRGAAGAADVGAAVPAGQ